MKDELLYIEALKTIEKHINSIDENSSEFAEIIRASDIVEQYEEKNYPMPRANIIDNIRFWFQYDLRKIFNKFRR